MHSSHTIRENSFLPLRKIRYCCMFNNNNARLLFEEVFWISHMMKSEDMATRREPLVWEGAGFSRVITRSDVIHLCVNRENCRAISPILQYRTCSFIWYFIFYAFSIEHRYHGYYRTWQRLFEVSPLMHSVCLIIFCKILWTALSQNPESCLPRQHHKLTS